MTKRQAPILLLLFAVTVLLHWYIGTFHSEFGRYQDEGMHYVTGLLIHDYVASGDWKHPMAFARNYYLHFPKVGLGQWPPVFYILQAAWTLIFGVSRPSLMFLMVSLAAILAFLVYREAAAVWGKLYGLLAAVLLIAAPLTQAHTAMVMAEILLAIFSLLAVLAWIRLLETGEGRDALWFGVWTMAAMMTKGNAWAILPVLPATVLLTGKFKILRNRSFWMAIGLVLLICVPYNWFTLRIVSQAMDTLSFPGFDYLGLSLVKHLGFVIGVLGVPLSCVALVGVVDRALVPLVRRKASVYWIGMAAYGASIIAFHTVVPTSIESRKIYQIVPVVCLFVMAGADAIARPLSARFGVNAARLAAAAAVVLLFITTSFHFLPPFTPGFAAAVEKLVGRPDTRDAAVLISSNPFLEDAEAAIISEWASRERKAGTYLVRATKLLDRVGRNEYGEAVYQTAYGSDEDVLRGLDEVPISYVIVHTTTADRSYEHDAQLRRALAGHPAQWEKIYESRRVLDKPHEIEIYRSRRDLQGVPVHFSVDLSRKIGSSIESGTVK
jgi:4-amino-4-deoxy-L-arabinose transferase-like glycosyltransferase